MSANDVIAHLLVTEGFSSVEEVAFVPLEDLVDIEGFDETIADELQNRARAYLAELDERSEVKRKDMGVADEVAAIEGLSPPMLVKLGEKGVKTLDDLGDLASDELIDILGKDQMDEDQANAVIMAARAHWFEGTDG